MNDKLAVILASGDPRVLEMGLMYVRNASKQGWMSDVKIFLFGPSETQVSTDPALREAVAEMIADGLVQIGRASCRERV